MKKVAIVTDTNSGIFPAQAEEMGGVFVVPMPISINGADYEEGVSITAEEFYRRQAEGADITTAQPSPAAMAGLWARVLEEYESLVFIPMTSGLSGTCATAQMLSGGFDGRVTVVDNCAISATLKMAVLEARRLADQGAQPEEIRRRLEDHADNVCIYITVNTLKYLKKGGRVTPAAAAIGDVLNIRPVMKIERGKLDAFAKVRGRKNSKAAIVQAMKDDLAGRFAAFREQGLVRPHIAHTGIPEEAAAWKEELETVHFPGCTVEVHELPLSIGTHTGQGALGAGFTIDMAPWEGLPRMRF